MTPQGKLKNSSNDCVVESLPGVISMSAINSRLQKFLAERFDRSPEGFIAAFSRTVFGDVDADNRSGNSCRRNLVDRSAAHPDARRCRMFGLALSMSRHPRHPGMQMLTLHWTDVVGSLRFAGLALDFGRFGSGGQATGRKDLIKELVGFYSGIPCAAVFAVVAPYHHELSVIRRSGQVENGGRVRIARRPITAQIERRSPEVFGWLQPRPRGLEGGLMDRNFGARYRLQEAVIGIDETKNGSPCRATRLKVAGLLQAGGSRMT
jgi:hypothetical protein